MGVMMAGRRVRNVTTASVTMAAVNVTWAVSRHNVDGGRRRKRRKRTVVAV